MKPLSQRFASVASSSATAGITWQAIDSLSYQFELCKIADAESVVLISDQHSKPELVELTRIALARKGRPGLELRPFEPNRGALKALIASAYQVLEDASLIVDVTGNGDVALLMKSQNSNASVLRLEPEATDTVRWRPQSTLSRRINALSRICKAKQRLVVGLNSTDLIVDLTQCKVEKRDGIAFLPNETAQFPDGQVVITPENHVGVGSIVVLPGDGVLTVGTWVRSPMLITMTSGRIRSIVGDHGDGDTLRALLEDEDENNYRLRSISIGLHAGYESWIPGFDGALLNPNMAAMLAGVVCMNFGAPGAPSHRLQLALAGRDLYIDERAIILGGMLQGSFAPDIYETAN